MIFFRFCSGTALGSGRLEGDEAREAAAALEEMMLSSGLVVAQGDSDRRITRSRAASTSTPAADGGAMVEMPDRLVLHCHRAGKPTGTGKRKSKRCECTFRVELSVVCDEAGDVEAFQYTEIGEHVGHVPGDEEDMQWLALDAEHEKIITKV